MRCCRVPLACLNHESCWILVHLTYKSRNATRPYEALAIGDRSGSKDSPRCQNYAPFYLPVKDLAAGFTPRCGFGFQWMTGGPPFLTDPALRCAPRVCVACVFGEKGLTAAIMSDLSTNPRTPRAPRPSFPALNSNSPPRSRRLSPTSPSRRRSRSPSRSPGEPQPCAPEFRGRAPRPAPEFSGRGGANRWATNKRILVKT